MTKTVQRTPWTAHEEAIMRTHYPHLRAAEVARILGRRESQVHQKAKAMGIGNRPHTWVPVGSYRVNVHKGTPRLERKVSETPGAPHLHWVPVARLVYEAAHGPLPAGHVVIFARPELASTTLADITPDKLQALSRAELMRRNSSWNQSPEAARLTQLKGAINRQVNRITRTTREKENA